ncbi:SSU rRNA (adenine(1518)-N(6)/adenine(1519)-N(6))-dimethyltransferase [hydrothermal vent metagenome]|uniref:SSU rRNA (Adenine(1518)-N(6)/adenine(1519)-N(6))-dimethyltransferase n=1 Tax=hydrothermal vent metagenome TaxID=652676 RepID=A0A3B1DNC3_9ZZZZ
MALNIMSVHPKKYLGQNFLINPQVQQRIIESCSLRKTDVVLEIGPGKGALTHLIAPRVKKLIAVETDRQLAENLMQHFKGTHVEIVHADILKFPFEQLSDNLKIIGNLPYNISTPILQKVLFYRHKVSFFYMMVQREYGQRLLAKPHTKDYGSLTCFVQYYTKAKMLFKVSAGSFNPVPKVQSCFLCLDFTQRLTYKAHNEELLFKIIRLAFGQRRKTIKNALSNLMSKEDLNHLFETLSIDKKLRAENLSVEDYVKITNFMAS